jgi:hypothetical protein
VGLSALLTVSHMLLRSYPDSHSAAETLTAALQGSVPELQGKKRPASVYGQCGREIVAGVHVKVASEYAIIR